MADVLIFDDDPMIGSLLGQLFDSMGFSYQHYTNSADVSNLVQKSNCRLVVLDIMMPGMDGLSACRAIRANPATRHVRIAILTAKNFESDRQAGMSMGADLFINKPFDLGDLRDKLQDLISVPFPPATSIPTPPLVVAVYPGTTIIDARDIWIVFDAGTGLREFMVNHTPPSICWVAFSRYVPENQTEFPCVDQLRAESCQVRLAGPADAQDSLKNLAIRSAGLGRVSGKEAFTLYPLREGDFYFEPYVRGTCKYTRYPGTAIAYRLEIQGRSVVYCPINELSDDSNQWNQQENARFKEFIQGAHLMVHGFWRSRQQPSDGVPEGMRGAWEAVVDIALDAQIRRLVLLSYGREFNITGCRQQAQEKIASKQSSMECVIAEPRTELLL